MVPAWPRQPGSRRCREDFRGGREWQAAWASGALQRQSPAVSGQTSASFNRRIGAQADWCRRAVLMVPDMLVGCARCLSAHTVRVHV